MNAPDHSVETQLAVLHVKMDQLIALNETRGEDHETRLRELEKRKFPLPTIAVLVALIAVALNAMQYVIK